MCLNHSNQIIKETNEQPAFVYIVACDLISDYKSSACYADDTCLSRYVT